MGFIPRWKQFPCDSTINCHYVKVVICNVKAFVALSNTLKFTVIYAYKVLSIYQELLVSETERWGSMGDHVNHGGTWLQQTTKESTDQLIMFCRPFLNATVKLSWCVTEYMLSVVKSTISCYNYARHVSYSCSVNIPSASKSWNRHGYTPTVSLRRKRAPTSCYYAIT